MTDPNASKNGRTHVRGRRALRNAGAILTATVFAVSLFSTVFSLAGASSARAAETRGPAASVVAADRPVRLPYSGVETPLVLDASPSSEELVVYVNGEDGEQVEGYSFQAVLTSAEGESVICADTDKDGIIRFAEPAPGEYEIGLLTHGGFSSPQRITVTVEAPVKHEKLDVSDMVHDEDEVDPSEDDGQYGGNGESGGGNEGDTVEYVESGQEEIGTETVEIPLTDADGNQLYGAVPRLSEIYNETERYLYNADGSESRVKAVVDTDGYLVNAYKKNSEGEFIDCTYSVVDQFGYPVKGSNGEFLYIFDDVVALTTTEEQTVYRYTGWQTINGKVYYFDKNGNKVTGWQTINGLTYFFDEDGVRSSTMGIDVSTWNENINWSKVKDAGIEFVIIRCGFRGYGSGSLVRDNLFYSHMNGAKAAGLKVGVYFFTQAITEREAVEEASMCLDMVSGYKLNYPIFIDMEDAGSSSARTNRLTNAQRTAIVQAFCDTIRAAGYRAGLYANKYYLESKIYTSQLRSSTVIWLAHYTSGHTNYAGRYDMWQYSSTGRINGVSGPVDLNISYIGYTE